MTDPRLYAVATGVVLVRNRKAVGIRWTVIRTDMMHEDAELLVTMTRRFRGGWVTVMDQKQPKRVGQTIDMMAQNPRKGKRCKRRLSEATRNGRA